MSALHPLFAQILGEAMSVTASVTPKGHTPECPHFEDRFPWNCDCRSNPKEYRGWSISWDYGRFTATGPNYDASYEGPEDGWVGNGQQVDARTREALIEEIDAYIEEHPDSA